MPSHVQVTLGLVWCLDQWWWVCSWCWLACWICPLWEQIWSYKSLVQLPNCSLLHSVYSWVGTVLRVGDHFSGWCPHQWCRKTASWLISRCICFFCESYPVELTPMKESTDISDWMQFFQDLSIYFCLKLLCKHTCPSMFTHISEEGVRLVTVRVMLDWGFAEFVLEHVEGQMTLLGAGKWCTFFHQLCQWFWNVGEVGHKLTIVHY